jgi:Tol biopolymer transport system component
MARRLDVARGELTGDAMTLADAVGYDIAYNLGAFSVSAAGSVAYQTDILKRGELFWVDRTGNAAKVRINAPDVTRLATPNLSPDDQRAVVALESRGNIDIWVVDLVGGGVTRLTNDEDVDAFPIWSPRATEVVFGSRRTGNPSMYLQRANGSPGSENPLLQGGAPVFPLDWSSDERFLVYMVLDKETGLDLWALNMTGYQHQTRALVNTRSDERNGQLSPDGHWLAYATNESGRFEIKVVSFADPTRRWTVSTNGGTQPRWHPNGKELFFVAPDGELMAVPITIRNQAPSSIEIGTPVALFRTRIVTSSSAIAEYAVARDGRFLISQPAESAPTPITLLLNWKPPVSANSR